MSAEHHYAYLHHTLIVVHHVAMRMTVNLDPDVYAFARAYAGGKGISLSSAISELVRKAELASGADSPSSRLTRNEHGYFEVARTGKALTPEMVKELSEDELA